MLPHGARRDLCVLGLTTAGADRVAAFGSKRGRAVVLLHRLTVYQGWMERKRRDGRYPQCNKVQQVVRDGDVKFVFE